MILLRRNIISYIITKLAGAGFSSSVFFIWMLFLSEFDMYKFSREISNGSVWTIFFGYGIGCSVIIDLFTWKMKSRKLSLIILLYVIAGYALFLIKGMNGITIFAGSIGALFSLLFYFGTYISNKKTVCKYLFAMVLPLGFLILKNYDFTEKVHWQELQTKSTYTASYEYFNGKHEIPIRAEEGQTITFSIYVTNGNGGGHGFHVIDERGKMVGMSEESGGKMKIHVHKAGIYRLVLTGDDLMGSMKVVWSIDEKE